MPAPNPTVSPYYIVTYKGVNPAQPAMRNVGFADQASAQAAADLANFINPNLDAQVTTDANVYPGVATTHVQAAAKQKEHRR